MLLGVQASPGRSEEAAETIARLEEVHYVARTTGTYDIFVWAGFESTDALGSFLREKIGAIAAVQRVEAFMNLAIKKRTYGLVR